MSSAKLAAASRVCAACVLVSGLLSTGHASIRPADPGEYSNQNITCEFPVKLTHDCSMWQGATRPIAFGNHRMSLAAGSDGRTILLSRVRPGPDHNGFRFRAKPVGRTRILQSMRAIQCIGDALEHEGIRLQRLQPVHRGHRVEGYFLEFSDNAYDYLKQFTVLESEHWLPDHDRKRR